MGRDLFWFDRDVLVHAQGLQSRVEIVDRGEVVGATLKVENLYVHRWIKCSAPRDILPARKTLPSAQRSPPEGVVCFCGVVLYLAQVWCATFEFMEPQTKSQQFLDPMREPVKAETISEGGALVGFAGDEPIAVIKRNGKLVALSAICQHQRCTVIFKGDKKLFECPCHFSRYQLDGTVINGPTTKPLPPKKVELRDEFIWIG